ncbi:Gti1/Pac2 family-domain-containing protein [Schizophyllum amplum]|uniref:Gti1/Pac2 family-domain-containing protein n=1 Tax=Schizophyllum amplum TaxID=97359 RepID=A0A550CZJ7_9AGAR|nr:Gti1/Pac2 family-domain-containing protein [Auriculariopsis ampla]
MQEPTCANIRIRSTSDAHKIFYAVQLGILKMVTRRLDAEERAALRSGCIYVWEERGGGQNVEVNGLGIERFTEGRRWSPSRVRDEFLFYYEKYVPPVDITRPASDKQPPRDWDPLVKQTYSVFRVSPDLGTRKWHITAYFTQNTVDRLNTVDDLPAVGSLVVPDGLFKSTRVGKSRSKTDDAHPKASTTVHRTYAAFPSPHSSLPVSQGEASGSGGVRMFQPYQTHTDRAIVHPHPPAHRQASLESLRDAKSVSAASDVTHPSPNFCASSLLSSNACEPPTHLARRGSLDLMTAYPPLPSIPSIAPVAPSARSIYAVLDDPNMYSGASHSLSPVPPNAVPTRFSHSPVQPWPNDHRQVPSIHTYTPSAQPHILAPILVPPSPASEAGSSGSEGRSRAYERERGVGPDRDLAPLHVLTRTHPYRRDPADDHALRLFASGPPYDAPSSPPPATSPLSSHGHL